jgi:REP element-mobilizing transposase RayT
LATKSELKHRPVRFSGIQARAIGRGFSKAVEEGDYRILACAILPEHVHLVIKRHERTAERIVGHLKARATQELVAEGLHPFVQEMNGGRFPSVFPDRAWKVFLDSHDDVQSAVNYVRDNPAKEVLRGQSWAFVTSDGTDAAGRAAQVRPLNGVGI